MNAEQFADAVISLFAQHREDLGVYPEEDDTLLERQCEFENKFAALVCDYKGHDIGPDHCGKPDHDLCYRCKRFRIDIESENRG